jgi:hypothetical protein
MKLGLFALSFATVLQAAESHYVFRPCDFWSMAGGTNYTCSYIGPRIDVPTLSEVQRLEQIIVENQERINQLEKSLNDLESKLLP